MKPFPSTMAAARPCRRVLAVALALGAFGAEAAPYTYKGELMDHGAPAQGRYDLRVHAYADAAGKKALGGTLESYGVEVDGGRFSVDLDLPDSAAGTLWIDVALRKAGDGNADFVSLGVREPVTVNGGSCPDSWALDGNAGVPSGSFLGTTDNVPLVLKSAGQALGTLQYVNQGPSGNGMVWTLGANVALGAPVDAAGGSNKFGATVLGGGGFINGSLNPAYGVNQATGNFATTVGGAGNLAQGDYSVAMGFAAHALHRGSFIWACADCGQNIPSPVAPGQITADTSRDNEFVVSAVGGLRFYSSNGGTGLILDPSGTAKIVANSAGAFEVRNDGSVYHQRPVGDLSLAANGYARIWTANLPSGQVLGQGLEMNTDGSVYIRTNATGSAVGVRLAAGGGSWITMSDRNLKANIEPVDADDVLARLLELPVSTWNYKSTSASEVHMGPMAQDFHVAFGLNGDDDKGIAEVDANGVALAAIQGLNAKLERENAELRQRIDDLAAIVAGLQTAAKRR